MEALGVLISLHDIICHWSQETTRIKEKLENTKGKDPKIQEELNKLIEWHDEYCSKLEEYKSYSDETRQAMYSIRATYDNDTHLWIDRLMRPGFSHKAGITMI